MMRNALAWRPGPGGAFALALSGIIAFVPRGARANGAFPDEFSIHFPPNAAHRIFVGANFGMLVSEDDGATWRYACEPWVVSSSNAALTNENVSFYQLTADGSLLATSVTVTRSEDAACTWPTSGGAIAGEAVDDIFADPNNPSIVMAIAAFGLGGGGSYIVASHDGGKTFDSTRLLDTTSTSHDLLTGIEIARSNSSVVYATSVSTTSGLGQFYASTSAGAPNTWNVYPFNLTEVTSATQPRILTIDPQDEKKVYVRLGNGISDQIAATLDGGQSFQIVKKIDGQLSSFLRAGDGALYAGTNGGNLYVRPAGAATFEAQPRTAPHLRCLGQRPGTTRIYGCGDMVLDGFSVGYSDDNAATWHSMMSFTQLLGPLTCAPVQTNCQAHWERIQGVLGIGVIPDAGQGDGGGGGGGGGGGSPKGSCASAGVDATALLLLAGFLFRRRRPS